MICPRGGVFPILAVTIAPITRPPIPHERNLAAGVEPAATLLSLWPCNVRHRKNSFAWRLRSDSPTICHVIASVDGTDGEVLEEMVVHGWLIIAQDITL